MLWLFGEVTVSILPLDFARMFPACGGPLQIFGQATGVNDSQLIGQVRHNICWHVYRVGQESAQETNRPELQGETKTVVVAPSPSNQ